MADDGNKRAALALTLAEKYDRLLSTILIGNNIVNIAATSIATVLFVHILGDKGATVSTIVLTVVVLIFGEITPKSIAKDRPESFAMFSAPLIRFFMILLAPLNALFSLWKRLINRLFKPADNGGMSQEELAERAMMSRSHLSAIEAPNIVRPFSVEILFNISDALGVEPSELLGMSVVPDSILSKKKKD